MNLVHIMIVICYWGCGIVVGGCLGGWSRSGSWSYRRTCCRGRCRGIIGIVILLLRYCLVLLGLFLILLTVVAILLVWC